MASQVFTVARAENDQIQKGVQAMVLASRVHRLAEEGPRTGTHRRRSGAVTSAGVALGGKLKIVADFGDEIYVLG
ncbi:hypothetical protein M2271_005077 [Streptomyces sp. LBL]|uniref:hypothetical protein n=1 Tax=Streptomyces sp. LBL TaxID=2940562 RepID=UPI002475267B|nr:hypothetical protein [Streptomyces sp. LBL]MDH6627253.1 hypothetical protein [Streptomyces sp. LBL]